MLRWTTYLYWSFRSRQLHCVNFDVTVSYARNCSASSSSLGVSLWGVTGPVDCHLYVTSLLVNDKGVWLDICYLIQASHPKVHLFLAECCHAIGRVGNGSLMWLICKEQLVDFDFRFGPYPCIVFILVSRLHFIQLRVHLFSQFVDTMFYQKHYDPGTCLYMVVSR